MEQFILKTTKEQDILPLFYAESGSRLWGFHSKDSDYDIRGIHLLSKENYFKISKSKEVVEVMEGKKDLVSFSIDKAFQLILNSNPSLLEWFRGDIIYFNKIENYEKLKSEVLKNINLKALYHHYISMGKQNYIKYIEKEKQFTYKKVLYVLRGVLSAIYVYNKKTAPPLQTDTLISQLNFDTQTNLLLKNLLKKKKSGSERELVKNKDHVKKVIDNLFDQTKNISAPVTGDKKRLLDILNNFSIKAKEKFYL